MLTKEEIKIVKELRLTAKVVGSLLMLFGYGVIVFLVEGDPVVYIAIILLHFVIEGGSNLFDKGMESDREIIDSWYKVKNK